MTSRKKNIILSIISIVIAVIMLFPIYWLITCSFKTNAEIFAKVPTFLPQHFTFDAYVAQVAGGSNIGRSFLNSSIIALTAMVFSCALAIPGAYGLARFKMKASKIFVMLFLVTQMLPATLTLTPMYLIYNKIGLIDTYFAPILSDMTIGIPFVILILRTYFLSLPKELEDSAKIDGCNAFTAFLRIMLPISYPGIIMCAVFSFLFAWGDLAYSLTFVTSENMRSLTAGIYNFIGKYGIQWNCIMAYGTVITIPVLCIFVFLQKYIVSGLTNGAVKG
ncbi:MAG TPA: carbohydrate ABC transporter permease [Oscillospiraceae bacterium]|nr:carbohydrate ABC transporter permease [Oscillospiraceae bacterium]